MGRREGGQGEVRAQLRGDFANGLVGSQNELKPLLLLQQVGDIILQVGFLVFQDISFL